MKKYGKRKRASLLASILAVALLFGLLPAVSLPTAAANDYLFPVKNGYLAYYYGYTEAYGDWHSGLDIHERGDDTIYAAYSGIVEAIADSCPHWSYGAPCDHWTTFGNYIRIRQDDGKYAYYGHLTQGSLKVSVGQRVEKGTPIAIMGSSGYSTGKHLHFEVRNSLSPSDTINVNPTSSGGSITYSYDGYGGVPSYTYTSITPGNYYLKNKATGKCLCVASAKDANGQNIDIWEYSAGDKAEIFSITATTNGYKMRPLCSSSRLVNAWGDSPSSGSNVNLYDDVNDSSQWWKFEKTNGGYFIHNVYAPSCVLDTNWTTALIHSKHGGDSQIWELIPAEHTCNKGKFVYFWAEHPHYNCYECSVCGNVWHDTSEPTKLESCEKCYPPVTPSAKNTYYFDESYNSDGTITVEVGLQTVGIVAIAGGVTFDPNVLECLEIDKSNSSFETVVGPQEQVGNRNGQLNFSADSASSPGNLIGKVRLFTAVFRPKKQTTTTFRGTVDSACTIDLNDVSFTANEKTISTVGTPTVSFVWGDVDGNGKVESKDKVLVARYLAKWAMNGGFKKAAADFNKDGDVTSAEAVVLARYLAKWTNLPYPVGQKAS